MFYHCSIDVEGMLRSHKKKGSLEGMFRENGQPVPDDKARHYLEKCLAEGKAVIPGSSKCDNFDYAEGRCMGHPDPKEQP